MNTEHNAKSKLKKQRNLILIGIVVVILFFVFYTKKKADVLYSQAVTDRMNGVMTELGVDSLEGIPFMTDAESDSIYLCNNVYYPQSGTITIKATQPTTGQVTAAFLVGNDGTVYNPTDVLNFYYGVLYMSFEGISEEDFENLKYIDILRSEFPPGSTYDPDQEYEKRIRFEFVAP